MYEQKIEKITLKKIRKKFNKYYSFCYDDDFRKWVDSYDYISYTLNNKKIIATLLIKECPEFPRIWQLGRIIVNEDFRKNNVGSKLLKNTEDFIKEKNGAKILVHVSDTNKPAQAFYKKNNYLKEATIKKMKLGKENLNIYSKEIKGDKR